MKINFINKKAIALIMATTFTLGSFGCSSNQDEVTTNSKNQVEVVEQEQNSNTSEQDVVEYMSGKYDQLVDFLNSDNVDAFKNEINQTLAEMVGFVFYDDPILGVSLKDMTDAGKQKVGEIWQKTASLMYDKYPEFTIEVKDGFNGAKIQGAELYNSGKDALNGALKVVMGDENYNSISEKIGDGIDNGKQKVYQWYQKYNQNN